jgi:hypothetical protein
MEDERNHQTHHVNAAGTAAVAASYYWMRCGAGTPIGVKLQLLTKGGVAIYGQYKTGDKDFTHWAPLPRRRHGEADD